jgi:hypothetical protein
VIGSKLQCGTLEFGNRTAHPPSTRAQARATWKDFIDSVAVLRKSVEDKPDEGKQQGYRGKRKERIEHLVPHFRDELITLRPSPHPRANGASNRACPSANGSTRRTGDDKAASAAEACANQRRASRERHGDNNGEEQPRATFPRGKPIRAIFNER